MKFLIPVLVAALPLPALMTVPAGAQSLASSYTTRDGRASTVVIACPATDGSFTAGPCSLSKPAPVTYAVPAAAAIATANVAVTVFTAGSVANGCDVVNTGAAILYLDFTTTAAAGSATSLPLQPGQSYHCPFALVGAVTAVASQSQPLVAVRY